MSAENPNSCNVLQWECTKDTVGLLLPSPLKLEALFFCVVAEDELFLNEAADLLCVGVTALAVTQETWEKYEQIQACNAAIAACATALVFPPPTTEPPAAVVPPAVTVVTPVPPSSGNCPATVGPTGPDNCGSLSGVQNQNDCQLANDVRAALSLNGQLSCGTAVGLVCGDSTFPGASHWCSFCENNEFGTIPASCFAAWYNIADSPICATFVTCPS